MERAARFRCYGWQVAARDPSLDRDTLIDRRTQLGVGSETVKPRSDLSGTVAGGYVIGEELGSGAMGAVYRASHLDTGRVVAIKALHPHLLEEAQVVARFQREAKTAARLGHPHIGSVFEVVQAEDGSLLMVLEYVEGEPLTSLITMPLPAERVFTIIAQLLRGLEHAHAAGLVHRDLKPDNVLIEWRNGRDHARIIDFGIAILRDPTDTDSASRLTGAGMVLGTPPYMAPEQARGEVVDERADLFSVGMIAWEMLAGTLPFDGKRAIQLLEASLRRDPPPFAERVSGLLVEPMHERYVRKLLARDRPLRFASARHALDVLTLMLKDPEAAGPSLGIMNVERALAVVSLPDLPRP
jgi:eukaryotic-like serine/threonine-protein kinase